MTHQDPSSMMNPAFVPSAGPPPTMMNGGQRMYAPSLPPLGGQRTAMRGPTPAMNFGYYPFPDGSQQPMAAMCPPPGGFQQMPPTAAAPGLHLQPSGDLQQQQPQPGPSTGRRNNATDATGGGSGTGKKKKTKTTKTRAAPARGGNGRGGANAPNKVVGNPSVAMGGGSLPPVGAIGGPPMGSSQPPPPQMMGGPGMVGVLPQSGPPQMWSTSLPRSPSQPNPNIVPNGGSMNPMNPLQPPLTSTQQQQQIMATQQTPAGTPHYGPTPHQRGRAMKYALFILNNSNFKLFSLYLFITEKLGYPIPNGLLVRSTKLQIDEDQARQSLNTPQVRVLEFDISQGHLSTIIGRSDLDIAISCHLASEPPQVCHWADDVLEIRFNDRVLPMDRRVLKDGSIAHRVATVKDFCNVTKNKLEIFLSPIGRSSQTDLSLSDFLFTVFMIHMPSIKLVLEGSIRLILSSQLTFLKRIVEYCRPRDPHSQIFAAEIALVCPVFKTRIKIPARLSTATGIDGFVVDYVLHLLFPVVPERFNAIRVRSDAVWRPVISDAPGPEIEEWTPIFGPYTDTFAYYMEHGTQLPNHLPSFLTNGIVENSRHSPLTNKQSQQQRAPDNQFNPSQPQFQSVVQLSSSSYATTQPGKIESEPNQKKRVLSTTQAPISSLPDLTLGAEGVHTNPKSLPSTPTFPKNSPTGPKPDSSNGGGNNLKRSRGSSFGEEETQNSHENPPKMSRLAIAQQPRQLNEDPETLAALQELPDLSLLSRPDVLEVIYSLTKSIKQ
ncbi:unnamed protein product [Hymenolepis diminuta]|uniref:SP-RING-type domain-containing protein n=1 Tax=Hymenolepis diminuta TaxID=6216 RepID=A0A158QCP1_HYMDI|nr:unnamed protein product [Hymenolepis diminuta]